MLCLLPLATMAQTSTANDEATPEIVHQELGVRMMQYVEELNELAIVSNIKITFIDAVPLSITYINTLKDKVNLLYERYNSINFRWNTFIQAMQIDIADDESLMSTMSKVELQKQAIADTIAAKKDQCNAMLDFAQTEQLLAGQDTVYKNIYHEAFKLSLIQKLTPRLEKLKAREQVTFAQLQASYEKAQQACETFPALKKRLPILEDTFTNIQMVSAKIQETAYVPLIQRIKDYLIGLACVAILLLFFNMLSAKIKTIKAAREQAKQYREMMRNNGNAGGYPTI